MAVRPALAAAAALALLASVSALPVSFNHGVASGDPQHDRIIIWTRVEPRAIETYEAVVDGATKTMFRSATNQTYEVSWVVSTERDLSAVVRTGTFTTDASRDYTVKVDVDGLAPGVQYFYGFSVPGKDTVQGAAATYTVRSPVGLFRLPHPEGSPLQQRLRYAVFSCSNWGWGYFNAYDAASRYDLDFWIHLGDYIYEYGLLTYPSPEQAVRWQDPSQSGIVPRDEIVSLDDYRKRHALYRRDPGLQALSAKAPLLSIWDDHEFTNNARLNTAQNHQTPTEGDYQVRKENARKVYYEWMPIREVEEGQFIGFKLNKTLSFGNLAKVFLLEERVTARSDEPVPDSATTDESTYHYGTSIDTRVGAVVDNKTDTSYTADEIAALQAIKQAADTIKTNSSNHIIGDEQLAWMDAETKAGVDAGTTWLLYNHGTIFFETYSDFKRAIEQQRAVDPVKAAQWQQYYDNILGGQGDTTTSYGTQCYNRPYWGKPLPISPAMRVAMRRAQAEAEYKIMNYFDSFQGYVEEKNKFLGIVKQAPNVVQYAGDSHAEWAGVQKLNGEVVLAEFDAGSVTSPSFENNAFIPLEFYTAALLAGSYDEGLRYHFVGKKGFMVVELDHEVHHVDYIHVDSWCNPSYTARCEAAFDVTSNRASAPHTKEPVPSKCRPVPDVRPYEKINTRFATQVGQQYSFVRRQQ